jgi:hypothetical protein
LVVWSIESSEMTDNLDDLPRRPMKRRRPDGTPLKEGMPSPKSPTTRKIPLNSRDSFIEYLISNESSILLKIVGGAIGVPLLGYSASRKGELRDQLPTDPSSMVALALVTAAVGAVMGGFLGVKDWVQMRKAKKLPVPLIVNICFGFGIWSLLFVWVPLIFLATIAWLACFVASKSPLG